MNGTPEESILLRFLDDSDLISTDFGVAGSDSPRTSQGDSSMPIQGVSLLITQAQKMQLRAMGFEDSVIRILTPEEAHKVLGLKP